MSANIFLDTNIIVYAYDSSDSDKQNRSQEIICRGIEEETGTISVQVLGEFFTIVTRKIQNRMPAAEAANIIELLCIMHVMETDITMVRRAMETTKTYQISYWDSLIIAAAERAKCRRIYSEDLNHGQRYNEIQVVNPFL